MQLAHWWKGKRTEWNWRYENKLFWWQDWEDRKEFPTWLIEAKKGQGKSRYLARCAVEDMRAGIVVASNMTIRDRKTGMETIKCNNWLDILRLSVWALENNIPLKFYIDEIHLWLDSRAFKLTPAWFRGWLAQSRHYGVGICGSVQNLRRVEVVLRELVDSLHTVENWNFRLFLGLWGPWVPLFVLRWVDPDAIPIEDQGSPIEYVYTKSRPRWGKWWGGYDTRELISVEPWPSEHDKSPEAVRKREALDAEVAALLDKANELVAPGVILAFHDEFPEYVMKPDLPKFNKAA